MGTLRPPQKQIAKSRARVKAKKQFTQRCRSLISSVNIFNLFFRMIAEIFYTKREKMLGCVFFPPRCEQQLGNSPAVADVTSQSRWVTSVTTRVTVQLSTTRRLSRRTSVTKRLWSGGAPIHPSGQSQTVPTSLLQGC